LQDLILFSNKVNLFNAEQKEENKNCKEKEARKNCKAEKSFGYKTKKEKNKKTLWIPDQVGDDK
jgi:hypothetical protein